MTVLVVAGTGIRRLLRDRSALFFLIVLPILIIVVIGTVVTGGDQVRVGLVEQGRGPLTSGLAAALRRSSALKVTEFATPERLATAVRRSEVAAGVVLPADLDATLGGGSKASIAVLAEPGNGEQQAAVAAIDAVVADQATVVQAARFTVDQAGVSAGQALAQAGQQAGRVPVATVRITTAGRTSVLPKGFGYSAPTMLVLFVFINGVAGATSIIQSRQLGIHGRALEAVSPRTIVVGEILCTVGICLLQALIIIGVGAAAFGVHWGSEPAAGVLVVVWALVGAGAGALASAVFRTPEQAGAVGPTVGVALGMLGGCMWPLEIVGPTMRTVGHLVPHAWAVDAFVTLTSRHGGLSDIAGDLAVLGGFAIVLGVAASVAMGRRLTEVEPG